MSASGIALVLRSCTVAAFIAVAPAMGAERLTFTPYHANNAYAPGEKVGWTVTLAPGAKPEPGTYSYRITKNETEVVKTGSFDLSSGSAVIETESAAPASFRVVVDHMLPPPPPPLTAAEAEQVNAALRSLLLKTEPALKSVLDKYPEYQFVPARRFDVIDLMEDRVATLSATVTTGCAASRSSSRGPCARP